MEIDKVRALTDTELVTELAAAKRNLYDLRFQLATRQLTDFSQIPQTRRRIARILTVMTERQLNETMLPAAATSGDGNGRGSRLPARRSRAGSTSATAQPTSARSGGRADAADEGKTTSRRKSSAARATAERESTTGRRTGRGRSTEK